MHKVEITRNDMVMNIEHVNIGGFFSGSLSPTADTTWSPYDCVDCFARVASAVSYFAARVGSCFLRRLVYFESSPLPFVTRNVSS